jgi:uncharacterized coiled-coil protein SlyX
MRETKIICNACGAGMTKIFVLILMGFVFVTPVLAETGSISVLADPKDFVIENYIQQDITGQIIDPKDSIPITANYSELLHISPVFFNNKISYSVDDTSKLSNLLIIQTPVMARYIDASGKWGGMEYTAPTGEYNLSVDQNGLIAALLNAIKEQQADLDAKQVIIEKQQAQIDDLTKRMEALEAKVK